ncbi:MAG: hypothetical protein IAE78_20845 [Myxococcus sp.]|nr:hypothetical protein [Myxococcus sp.]
MAVIERVFDKRSPTVKQELATFQAELAAFEQRVSPASIITRAQREGNRLRITAISAQVKVPAHGGSSWVEPWKP